MNKNILQIIILALYTVIIAIILIPIIYWFINDYYTSMQIFKKFWYILTIDIFLYIGIGVLEYYGGKNGKRNK